MTAEIEAALPDMSREQLLHMRDLIFAAAKATGTGPLTETLKWGQPAYLPAKRAGTTLRLGVSDGRPTLYVHCGTNLIDRYRSQFPDDFTYSGNRAVQMPKDGPFPDVAFQQIAAMALTYHRDKV
ncbi:DUF1801 domain-containing protein [Gymnodinialimonas mytili]|uniref:DUF1801 domain-containing protein n=1 Tax=Gymnodinialimonas mytili TaxID=3126503 RepID=UPI0030EB52D9